MKRIDTPLNDVYLIEPTVHGDQRGFFLETWSQQTFKKIGIDVNFVQDNHSKSTQGTLRGMHFQTNRTQGKLVRVLAGEVFDAAIDLRRESSTYGQWYGEILSAENFKMLWVPPGFAHGFYVISETAEFSYKCTDFYDPTSEVSIAWDDPEIGIDWPLVNGQPPTLSTKDIEAIAFKAAPKF